jgi:hypothetical protein
MKKSLYWTKPPYITDKTWNSLTDKERDYICLLRQKKYSPEKIMRRLYITTRQGYYYMQRKVTRLIEEDVKSFNKKD